jgi:hypothetical protein
VVDPPFVKAGLDDEDDDTTVAISNSTETRRQHIRLLAKRLINPVIGTSSSMFLFLFPLMGLTTSQSIQRANWN